MKIFACLLLLAVCAPSVFVTAQVTEDQIAFCIIDGFYWDTYSIQYFFFDTTYGRWSAQTKTLQSGYPKDISVGWPGIPNRFDAVLDYTLPNHLYFFKAGQYWRWSIGGIDQADPPYPRSISAWWPGVPDNLNAAFKWMNQYYFLSGTQYYIFDPVQNQVTESGLISSKWPGIPSNLDTAFVYSDTWLYFFKGLKYWRWDLTGAAPSYPKNICDNWGICNYMLCAIQVAPIAPAFAAQSAAVTTQQFVTASNIQPSNATTSSNSTSTLRGFVSTTSTEQPAPGPDTNATESATAQTFVSAASINSNSTTP